VPPIEPRRREHPSPVDILHTHRLTLRELALDDAPELFRIYGDPLTMRYMGPPPASVEAEAANIANHLQNSCARWGFGLRAVVLKETGAFIGRCGLLRCELDGKPEVELSYLLDRQRWGSGYATEADAAIVRWAFDSLPIAQLVAFIAPANAASARVAERLAFRPVGKVDYKTFGTVDLYVRKRGDCASPLKRHLDH
jgi:ribosomal-protein-alanine N-acetyltransferase